MWRKRKSINQTNRKKNRNKVEKKKLFCIKIEPNQLDIQIGFCGVLQNW